MTPKPLLFLARHATPDWSRTDIRYDIPPGPPLTQQGLAEARQLGFFLAQAGVKRLYASPLERTQRTASIAGEIMGVPVQTVNAIAEWQRGESTTLVLARMLPFWEELAAVGIASGPAALVSHGGPIRLLLEKLTGDPAWISTFCRRFDHNNPLPPAGVWQASDNGRGGWALDLVYVP
jgi:broad specificity phosphatase PhoE